MYKILYYIGDDGACSYYRNILPTIHCRDELAKHNISLEMAGKFTVDPNNIYDCYIFSRAIEPSAFVFVHRLYALGKKIIWDFDDELWNVPECNTGHDYFARPVTQYFLNLCVGLSAHVTCSTDNLKESAVANFGMSPRKVTVLENLIDLSDYSNMSIRRDKHKLRVLWSGSDSHVADLELIRHVYDEYKHRDDLLFIFHGFMPKGYEAEPQTKIMFIPWGPFKHYSGMLSLLSPDIALIPLVDDKFNRCKSAIKYYQMSLAGAASIASDVSPYSATVIHGDAGFLVNNESGWLYCFDMLINNNSMIRDMRESATIRVIDSFSWESKASRRNRAWIEFLKSIPDM